MGRSVHWRPCGFLAATLALLISSGCGAGGSSNGVTNSAPQMGQLVLSPSALNFGGVNVGTGKTLPVTIFNTNTRQASSTVTISKFDLSGQGFSLGGLTLPLTLGPGQNAAFNVTFTPQAPGNDTGTVSVVSTTANQPTLSLTGQGTTPSQHSVDLSWISSISPVVGYNVYRGVQSGGPYGKINTPLVIGTVYTDSSVQGGQTYYYVTTAVDSQGLESVYSNEAQAIIP